MIDSPPPPLRRLTALLATGSILALAACGGRAAGEPPRAPEHERALDTSAPEPTTIDQAERDIARAKAELGAWEAGSARSPAATDGAPESMARAEPAQPRQPSRPLEPSQPSQAAEPAPLDGRCVSSCRAIASMRRAVTALCRMTGDDDTRCVGAKRTLTDSETRVTTCSC